MDESSNSSTTATCLLPRNFSQHVVGNTFHEPGSEQRWSDEPIANILSVRQRFFLCRRTTHGLCCYKRSAGRRYEFVICSEVPRPEFGYRATYARQTSTALGQLPRHADTFDDLNVE